MSMPDAERAERRAIAEATIVERAGPGQNPGSDQAV